MRKRIGFPEAYSQLVKAHNELVDVVDDLRREIKAMQNDIEYLKRLSRAPYARRSPK